MLQKLIELGNHNSTAVSTSNSVPLTPERFKITMGTSWVSIMRPLKRANYKTSECSWEPVPHLKMANILPRATLKAQESGHPDGRASEPLTLVQQNLLNVFHTILEKMEILLATPKIFKKRGKKGKSPQLWAACLELAPSDRIAQKCLHSQEFLKLHSLKVHAKICPTKS